VNALLQVLNAFAHISLKLIARPTKSLFRAKRVDSFAHQFRDVLAALHFTRGQCLSIQMLIDAIPHFNIHMQQDAGESLHKVITRLQEDLEDPREIIDHIRGQQTTLIGSGSERIAVGGLLLPLTPHEELESSGRDTRGVFR
jgi:hypothetical protein